MTIDISAELEPLVRARPVVLVAVPDLLALERVVLSGALARIGRDRRLHYVLPETTAASLRAAAPAISGENASTLCPRQAAANAVELFDRLMPLYCVVPTPIEAWTREVILACESHNVACLVLQTGWGDLSCAGTIGGTAPFLGCWGPQSKDAAIALHQLSHKRIGELGAPQHRWLVPPPAETVRRLRALLGVEDGGRLLLFGGSSRGFDDLNALRHIDRAIARGRLEPMRVVYRPHPRAALRPDFHGRAWRHVVLDPEEPDRAAGGVVPEAARVATLVAACDAVVTPLSTLAVEALILDKPVLALAFGGTPDGSAVAERFAPVHQSSALIVCENPARLVRDCARLFTPREDDKIARAKTALLDRVVTRERGGYAERLADFCHARVDSVGRKMRAQRTGIKRTTISHTYGAHLVAHDYTGVPGTAVVPGYWMHGWLPAYHNVHPALIALHKKAGQGGGYDYATQIADEKAHVPQWVARADQADYLAGHGYRHVHAIGLPIVYLPAPAVPRVPGSLLVMPPHGHCNHGPDDPLAAAYADAIADVRSRFAHVWVGVSEDDVTGRQWIEAFRRRGIDVFTTTDPGDPRTMTRLRRALSTFEYVTTNGFGSHIALAAYCGAKVSVFGPFAPFPRERMQATHAVKIHPELVDAACDLCTEAGLRRAYGFLFVDPDLAVPRPEWGAAEVGEPCRLPPAELRTRFGWDTA